ncbi:DNAJ heat shock N-terminal domain-containing protein [Cucumis melo var. makuwa]|uniref:DNAJ heat shock N-terminal domain-containing protein n=1 Tax=Cucumis melo var. makuwa TaxID=1194695 RepID=A0A5D3C5J8_CUCMM|nr:DNAJ heat shock N-terminal domain-containing protein [Cucumis melo var. makuwa]
MSEPRPVKRRESPWGMPEGEDRQPKAHRCNDRAEDVIQIEMIPEFVIDRYYAIYFNGLLGRH